MLCRFQVIVFRKKCITFMNCHLKIKKVELDFVYLDENLVFPYLNSSTMHFDSKKSKGEIESLTSTTALLQNSQLFNNINAFIVCYDAKKYKI